MTRVTVSSTAHGTTPLACAVLRSVPLALQLISSQQSSLHFIIIIIIIIIIMCLCALWLSS